MELIKYELIKTIEKFETDVWCDCRFTNIFDGILEYDNNDKIIIKGNVKSFIVKAIENCDREIAYKQESYINGDLELCTETLELYINLKKDLITFKNRIEKYYVEDVKKDILEKIDSCVQEAKYQLEKLEKEYASIGSGMNAISITMNIEQVKGELKAYNHMYDLIEVRYGK